MKNEINLKYICNCYFVEITYKWKNNVEQSNLTQVYNMWKNNRLLVDNFLNYKIFKKIRK